MSDAKTKNRNRAEQAFDNELRILQIVDMASMTATEAFQDRWLDGAMEDFVDHLLDSGAWKHASTAELSEIMQDGMHGDECEVVDSEDVIRSENAMRAARSGFLGIAMQFSSPVRKYTTEGSYYSGWGYTRSTWIYADTFDEAWDMGVLWALERDVADKAKLKESA